MLDFKKGNIYKRDRAKMNRFLDEKLVTLSEQDSLIELGDGEVESEYIDTESVMGGSPVDFGDDHDTWDESAMETGRERNIDLTNDRSYETGIWWKDILYAPWYLLVYVVKLLAYDTPDKEEWKSILKSLNKVTIFSALFALFCVIIDFDFIISSKFQAVTSGLMFGTSWAILKYGYGEGREKVTSEDADFDDLFGEMNGEVGTDDDEELSGLGGGGLSLMLDDEDVTREVPEGAPVMEMSGEVSGVLPMSPIQVEDDKLFSRGLLDVFAKNSVYEGVEITDRKELLESFSGYIITNDKNYGSWQVIQERTLEYNNIAYSLFKGLVQMQNAFSTDEEKMVIMDVRSNPLLYKIEVELPTYFKLNSVRSSLHEIESVLKKSEDDTEVSVTVSYYGGVFVFKFLRMDNTNLISLGDILRFYDEDRGGTALDEFADKNKGLPVLLGLRENEFPYVVDLEENTSGAIVGGSGSGKSWLTFLLMFNLVLANDYNNVQFVIFDKKNAPFWNQFAKFPHVLGYHTKDEEYLELLREVYSEIDRRKELLNELGAENVKGLRKQYRKEGNTEGLKDVPLLTIIIDEITSTMQSLETMYEEDKERYKEARNIISKITQEGRSLGVRLIMIGQSPIDSSIPRNAMRNSTFKFGMRLDAEGDFEHIYGKEVARLSKPRSLGLGLARTMEEPGIYMIKTLTPGGSSERQILQLIRVLALEWVRRSIGQDELIDPPNGVQFDKVYNRDRFIQESLQDLEEGRILHRKENVGYRLEDLRRGGVPSHHHSGNGEELYPVEDEESYEDEPIEVEDEESYEDEPIEVEPVQNDEIEPTQMKEELANQTINVKSNTTEPQQAERDNGGDESKDFKISNIEDFAATPDEIESSGGIEENTKYAEDDDDDIFGEFYMELDEGQEESLEDSSEIDLSKLFESPEVAEDEVIKVNVTEEGGNDYGLSLEEIMAQDKDEKPVEEVQITTDKKGVQCEHGCEVVCEHGCELSGYSGEKGEKGAETVKNGEKRENNEGLHIHRQTDHTEKIVKETVTVEDSGELSNKAHRKPENHYGNLNLQEPPLPKTPKTPVNVSVETEESTRSRGEQGNVKQGNTGNPPIQTGRIVEKVGNRPLQNNENQESIRSSVKQENRTGRDGRISIHFASKSNQVQQGTPTKSIKQYIIDNGQHDGILNRKILVEELEEIYTYHQIRQAVDMLTIIRDGDWYITKL